MLEQANEDCHASLQMIKASKTRSKSHYEPHVHPHTFSEGDLVLVYDQDNDKLGKGKFGSMWYGQYVIHRFLRKGKYILANSDNHLLKNPCNRLYLKRLYA